MGPNTGARGWGECGREPPPAVGVREYHRRKFFFENSDAKSCILVAFELINNNTCCEISCFLKTTAKSWDKYILVPQPKSWGPVSPVVAPMPFIPFLPPFSFHPLNPAVGSGECCKLSQWVRVEPDCQMVSGAFLAESRS